MREKLSRCVTPLLMANGTIAMKRNYIRIEKDRHNWESAVEEHTSPIYDTAWWPIVICRKGRLDAESQLVVTV